MSDKAVQGTSIVNSHLSLRLEATNRRVVTWITEPSHCSLLRQMNGKEKRAWERERPNTCQLKGHNGCWYEEKRKLVS